MVPLLPKKVFRKVSPKQRSSSPQPRAHNRVRTLELQLLLMSGGVEYQRKRAKRSRASSDNEEGVVESPGVSPVIRVDSPVATPAEEKTPDDTPVVDEETVPPIPLYGDGFARLHRLGTGGELRGTY